MSSQLQGVCSFSVFVAISRGTIHPVCSANFISFPPSIKELMLPILFFSSSVILPCICTVFKESFVYVFAIKKKMLLKKRTFCPLSHGIKIRKQSVMQHQCAKAPSNRLYLLFFPHARVSERVKRRVPRNRTSVCFPRSLVFFPLLLFSSSLSPRQLVAAGGEALWEVVVKGGGGGGSLQRIYFKRRHLGEKESGLNRSCFDKILVGEKEIRTDEPCKTGQWDGLLSKDLHSRRMNDELRLRLPSLISFRWAVKTCRHSRVHSGRAENTGCFYLFAKVVLGRSVHSTGGYRCFYYYLFSYI